MTRIIAHRGASAYAPENTLTAFRLAKEMGADGVELDVQMTRDGEIVVIHDEQVDRTTNGTGWVKNLSLGEIRSLNASFGNPIYTDEVVPTLGEVFDLLADSSLVINIELKDSLIQYPGMTEKVLEMVSGRNLSDRIIISSFNHVTLSGIRNGGSSVPTGMLFQDVLFEPWAYAQCLRASALHPHYKYVDGVEDVVLESHKAGLDVNVWTINDNADIDRMLVKGVDGIITNYPDQAVGRRNQYHG